MDGLEFDAGTARIHAPLVQRAAAISAALASGDTVSIVDGAARSPVRPQAAAITLNRAATPALRRGGARRFAIDYADAASEAALAALIACATRPGAPIAADPESLSVLALAERLAATDIPVVHPHVRHSARRLLPRG